MSLLRFTYGDTAPIRTRMTLEDAVSVAKEGHRGERQRRHGALAFSPSALVSLLRNATGARYQQAPGQTPALSIRFSQGPAW